MRNKAFLQRRVAWKIQELEFGGLSDKAKSRLDEQISKIDLPLGDPCPTRPRFHALDTLGALRARSPKILERILALAAGESRKESISPQLPTPNASQPPPYAAEDALPPRCGLQVPEDRPPDRERGSGDFRHVAGQRSNETAPILSLPPLANTTGIDSPGPERHVTAEELALMSSLLRRRQRTRRDGRG